MTPKEFAILKHGNQVRKYTGEPYWKHCEEVADLIAKTYGPNHIMVDVAWLHDTVEDTDTTFAEIEKHFGQSTMELVYWLTDPNIKGNRVTRKQISRVHIGRAPLFAKIVKLADMISNTRSIVEHDPGFAKIYMKEKHLLLLEIYKQSPIIQEENLYWQAFWLIQEYFAKGQTSDKT